MSNKYLELRALFFSDPAFRRLIVQVAREVINGEDLLARRGADAIPPGWVSYKQAAALVGASEYAVRRMVSKGYLDSDKFVGKPRYVNRTAFLEAVMRHMAAAQREKALALLGEQPEEMVDEGRVVNG